MGAKYYTKRVTSEILDSGNYTYSASVRAGQLEAKEKRQIEVVAHLGFCGDGRCDFPVEPVTCPQDCYVTTCGDRVCSGTETCLNCPDDCGVCSPVCGDGLCMDIESCSECPDDCGVCPPVCGDGVCDKDKDESCSNCPEDCGVCPPIYVDRCDELSPCIIWGITRPPNGTVIKTEGEIIHHDEYVVLPYDGGVILKLTVVTNGSQGWAKDRVIFRDAFNNGIVYDTIWFSEGIGEIPVNGHGVQVTMEGPYGIPNSLYNVTLNWDPINEIDVMESCHN